MRRRFTTTTTTVLQDDRGYAHHAGGLAQRSMGARPDRRADAGRAGRALHARPIRGGITVVTRGVAGVTADDDPRGRGNAAPGAVVRSVGATGSTRRRRRRTGSAAARGRHHRRSRRRAPHPRGVAAVDDRLLPPRQSRVPLRDQRLPHRRKPSGRPVRGGVGQHGQRPRPWHGADPRSPCRQRRLGMDLTPLATRG